MIDFVSTRPETDPDTRAAAQFMAGVIVQFLRDAGTKPTRIEQAEQRNVGHAADAIAYLFHPGSTIEDHLEAMGAGAPAFRAALLDTRFLMPNSSFSAEMRRIIQLRHRYWLLAGSPAPQADPEETNPPTGDAT